MIWWLKRPGTVSIDQCVCQDDKLSGDGDEGDFGKFAVVSQAPIEVAQCRVVPGSGEGGEVEDVAYTLSPSFDAALPAALTTVVGDGSEAGEQGDLLVGGGAEFRQAGDEQGCADRSDPGDGEEDLGSPSQGRVAGDTVCDLGLEALDILEHAADAPLQVTAQGR